MHTLAVYGAQDGGISQVLQCAQDIDVIQGTLSKGFGLIGGYIAGNASLVDAIRLHAHGFIFTISLPPQITATALYVLTMTNEIQQLQKQLFSIVDYVKTGLSDLGLRILPSTSQIIPVWIGDAAKCEHIAERLLHEFDIYIQPINFPTVRKGEERLRISPTARHTFSDADRLLHALSQCIS